MDLENVAMHDDLFFVRAGITCVDSNHSNQGGSGVNSAGPRCLCCGKDSMHEIDFASVLSLQRKLTKNNTIGPLLT